MKKITFIILFQAMVFQSCRTLTSTTYIDPAQSFVLGEGKHGSYAAEIKNTGKTSIEVFRTTENQTISLGLLKPKDKTTYQIAKDTRVMFKNLGTSQAAVELRVKGDTGLSMGYQENK